MLRIAGAIRPLPAKERGEVKKSARGDRHSIPQNPARVLANPGGATAFSSNRQRARGQRSVVDAGGRPRATIRMFWWVGPAQPGWVGEDGWIVEIDGAPRVRMNLQVLDPVGRPDKSKAIQYAVAGPVVRAIDDVCAAPPGILVPPSFAAFKAS